MQLHATGSSSLRQLGVPPASGLQACQASRPSSRRYVMLRTVHHATYVVRTTVHSLPQVTQADSVGAQDAVTTAEPLLAAMTILRYRTPFLLAGAVVASAFTSPRPKSSFVHSLAAGSKHSKSSASDHEDDDGLFLSFDLDDTLFPIDIAVEDANAALVGALRELGYDEVENDEMIRHSKCIRNELRARGEVITYTDLRKLSIQREICRVTNNQAFDDQSVIDSAFDAWLSERQASADRNLFPHAVESLQSIRENYPGVVIGAITNGRGDPLEMKNLAPFFDFCTSGEDEDVFPKRKPDRGIYEAALQRFQELKGSRPAVWVHVGDDLANDVGASAACSAKPIWLCKDTVDETPKWSTATTEELEKRARLNEEAKKLVKAKISSLEELPSAVASIL